MSRYRLRHRFLMWLTRGMPVRFITIGGNDYLERYFVGRLFGRTCYLHRFVSSDSERWLHDHPWRAVALVLTGYYKEQRKRYVCSQRGVLTDCKTVKAGRLNFIGLRTFHRILTAEVNTWTLFIHGPRVKSWGFEEEMRDAGGHLIAINYQQPLDLTQSIDWEKRAKLAREVRL